LLNLFGISNSNSSQRSCHVVLRTVSFDVCWWSIVDQTPPTSYLVRSVCRALRRKHLQSRGLTESGVSRALVYHQILVNLLTVKYFSFAFISWTMCLQLPEILEISLNLHGPPGNFCVKCRWSTLLVSSHDKTGYRIAYLRNWSPFFIFAAAPCCAYHVFVLYLGKLVDSVHCMAGGSNANMSWIFLEISPGISWKFVQLNL